MKYIKYTYVDGNHMPQVDGLEFVWARESQYPTNRPEFFGTCPDGSDTDVEGVLGVYSKQDWDNMHYDELRARVPQVVTMRQARLVMLEKGLLGGVDDAINSLQEPDRTRAKVEWDYAIEVWRNKGLVGFISTSLGLSEADVDNLFIEASKL